MRRHGTRTPVREAYEGRRSVVGASRRMVLCGTSRRDVGHVPRQVPHNGQPPCETYTLALGTRGRVVIPAKLRAALGVQVGDALAAWAVDGVLTLVPLEQIRPRLRGGGKPSTRSAVDALLEQRRTGRR